MRKIRSVIPLKNLFKVAGLPGYLLFFYNILMFFATRGRVLGSDNLIDTSVVIQLIYLSIVFVIAFSVLFKTSPKKRKLLFSTPQVFLLGYILVCFLSMLWSNNVMLTGIRAFESLVFVTLISWVVYNLIVKLSSQNIVEWAMLYIIWHLFWSVLIRIKLLGFNVLIWPFDSARLAIPVFLFFAVLLTRRKYFKYIVVIFAFLSFSNKVYFGLAFGLLGFYFGNGKYKSLLLLLTVIILLILNFVDFEVILQNTLFYGRETTTLASTSGRDKVWTLAWESFLQRPFFGYGFVSGENEVLYSKFQGAINAHNSFFSALLGTGLLGFIFIMMYFISTFKLASSTFFPRKKWRPAMVCTFIMCLIISSSSPGIGSRVYGSWVPIVLMFTIISGLQLKFMRNKIFLK